MSLAASHIAAAADFAASFTGQTVAAKRPLDVDYVDVENVQVGETSHTRDGDETDGHENLKYRRQIVVKVADLPGGVARVDLVFLIEGETWSVHSIDGGSGGYKTFTLSSYSTARRNRNSYRR